MVRCLGNINIIETNKMTVPMPIRASRQQWWQYSSVGDIYTWPTPHKHTAEKTCSPPRKQACDLSLWRDCPGSENTHSYHESSVQRRHKQQYTHRASSPVRLQHTYRASSPVRLQHTYRASSPVTRQLPISENNDDRSQTQ